MYLNIKISSGNQLTYIYLKSLGFAIQCAKWYITSLCFNLIGFYEVHMMSETSIVFIITPFVRSETIFISIGMLKQSTAFSSTEVKDVIYVQSAALRLCLFTVNVRLLTSSQVTIVSKEVTKGQLEKVRQSKWSLTLSWWKEWAEKADKEASWTLVWLLVWYSGVWVKSEMPHF